jgi:hypothetical protein
VLLLCKFWGLTMTTRKSTLLIVLLGTPALLMMAVAPGVVDAAADGPGVVIADPGVAPDCLTPTRTSPPQTTVGVWNCAALEEIRRSKALRNGPPIVARALAIAHTCMYDAWAAYDPKAVATTALRGTLRRPAEERTDTNKAKAISFAAYRCLTNLYPDAPSATRLGDVLVGQGYSAAEATNLDTTTPAGIGNVAAQAVIDERRDDGANQYGDKNPVPCVAGPPGGPAPANQLGDVPAGIAPLPCVVNTGAGAGTGPYADYDDVATGYTHYVPSNPLMGYCTPLLASCPAWINPVTLLNEGDPFIDPSAPWPNVADPTRWQPLIFSSHSRQTYVGAHFGRVRGFAVTSPEQFDGPVPAFSRNPGQYARDVEEIIAYSASLDAKRKLIVEYWADGPDSELPPGHWGLFAQFVSRRDQHTIDDDVKMFFALHNASFDAGIVGWYLKRKYDGVRPITAVRWLKQGQTIRAWGGPGRPTEDIRGEQWTPYNPGTNLTPPFPGFLSGHAVFSTASATVLKHFTGSDDFGFSTFIPACDPAFFGQDFLKCFGRVESGIPSGDTLVAFATFTDAADEAAVSRLYGGIHFADDASRAQQIGVRIGVQAWVKARRYFDGTAE